MRQAKVVLLTLLPLFTLLPTASAQTDLGALVERVREIKRQTPTCPDGNCFQDVAAALGIDRSKSRAVRSRPMAENEFASSAELFRSATIPNARMGRQTLNSVWFAMNHLGDTVALSICLGSGRTDAATAFLLRAVFERARPHLQNINRTGVVNLDPGLFQGVSDRMTQRTGDEITEDLLGLYSQYAGQLNGANLSCCQLNDGPVLPAPIIPNLASVAMSMGITGGVFACLTCSDTANASLAALHNGVVAESIRDLRVVQGCMTGVEVGALLRPIGSSSENSGAYLSYVYSIRDVSQALLANDCVCDVSSRVVVPPPPPTISGTLVGRVLSAATQLPISGATVAVGSGSPSTRTAADGRYQLGGVAPGNLSVTASAAGFLNSSQAVALAAEGRATVDFTLAVAPVTTGTLSGFIRNAANGAPISGVRISLSNSPLSDLSAVNGAFRIPGAPVGATVVTATLTGYAPATFNATVTANGTTNINLSISPVLEAGQLRITLNWLRNANNQPSDLDMHLYGPREGTTACFHVDYSSPGFLNSNPFAQLEVDNIEVPGLPPTETIRIARLIAGVYTLFIDNFSGGANLLSASQAQVAVFRGDQQISTLTVPSGPQEVWNVLTIDGTTGQIAVVNQMRTTFPELRCR